MQKLQDGRTVLLSGEVMPVFCPCGIVYLPEIDSDSSICPNRNCRRVNVHRLIEARPAAPFSLEDYSKPMRDLPWDRSYIEPGAPFIIGPEGGGPASTQTVTDMELPG